MGASQPWMSSAAAAAPATFGKTSVGGASEWFSADRKRVSKYALSVPGAVSELSVYLTPTANSGQQVLEGIVYANSSGSPGALLGTTTQLTFTSTSAAGWYHIPFLAPLELPAGEYWIGVITGASNGVAAYRYDTVPGARDYNANSYALGPTNPFGSFTTDNQQTSIYATYTPTGAASKPVNVSPPTISGVAQSGQQLSASPGSWTESPTAFAYQWLRCDASGANCSTLTGATSSTYNLASADAGTTLRVSVTASNAAGPSAPATSAQSAVVTAPQAPSNSTPPTISGTAQSGQTLTASPGTWSGSPTSFSYKWQRCDAGGANCSALAGATSSTYILVSADVGSTMRVGVIASNAAGPSAPATSAQSAVVQQNAPTFGKTSVGARSDHGMYANYKIVHSATLSVSGSVTKLSVYAIPGTNSPSPQALKAVIYADSEGSPGALVATGTEVSYSGATNGTGWFDLPFAAAVPLSPGTYWLGFITGASTKGMGYSYDSVANSRAYNTNTFSSGPSNPFGSSTKDSEQASIYATYTPTQVASKPVNVSQPTISGVPQSGQQLSASPGSWTESPTSFSYKWKRCDPSGANCAAVPGAISSTYTLASADVGTTLRVTVIASNAAGASAPATSTQSALVTSSSGVQHLEYVFDDSLTSVYDMDQGHKLLKTISLPQTEAGIRGVAACPPTHMLFIFYGGDGGPFGTGSVLAYDLVGEKVLWTVHLKTGIDSGAVSPDCKRLYSPSGENESGEIWNILDTTNGAIIGTIAGGGAPHNTLASNDGRYVYLGGRQSKYLDVYETATEKVRKIGPLVGTERPFTVNGSNTLAFTTATEFDGFQVSSVTTGKVLFTVSFGEIPKGFPFTTASHGISLSPDEKQLYVIDVVHKEVQTWDVSKVAEGIAPALIGVTPVAGWSGNETSCAYECTRGGWLQLSLDGRFLYVGDSGEVIETATRKVLTTLTTLLNTKKSLEIDWQNGLPVATSGRVGVGYVG